MGQRCLVLPCFVSLFRNIPLLMHLPDATAEALVRLSVHLDRNAIKNNLTSLQRAVRYDNSKCSTTNFLINAKQPTSLLVIRYLNGKLTHSLQRVFRPYALISCVHKSLVVKNSVIGAISQGDFKPDSRKCSGSLNNLARQVSQHWVLVAISAA
jgi:hypothetical protein